MFLFAFLELVPNLILYPFLVLDPEEGNICSWGIFSFCKDLLHLDLVLIMFQDPEQILKASIIILHLTALKYEISFILFASSRLFIILSTLAKTAFSDFLFGDGVQWSKTICILSLSDNLLRSNVRSISGSISSLQIFSARPNFMRSAFWTELMKSTRIGWNVFSRVRFRKLIGLTNLTWFVIQPSGHTFMWIETKLYAVWLFYWWSC